MLYENVEAVVAPILQQGSRSENRDCGNHNKEKQDDPDHLVAFGVVNPRPKLAFFFLFLFHNLQISNRIFELFSPVLVIFEKVETCAAWRK